MKMSIFPTPYSDGSETTYRFHHLPQSFADHVFKYVSDYTDQFRDADGMLPPMPALTDWEPGRYAWATLHPAIPAGIQITKVGDTWDFDISVETKDDPHQWIDILHIMKKVANHQFK